MSLTLMMDPINFEQYRIYKVEHETPITNFKSLEWNLNLKIKYISVPKTCDDFSLFGL